MALVGRLQSIMNGAGNVIPPSVDGNIHPEATARNLGTYYRSYHPELMSGLSSTSGQSNGASALSLLKPRPTGTPSRTVEAAAPSALSLDYLNADLAKYYGMSKETAYNEALSNTAYQRAVKDMQAAGLNPAVLFGAGRASTADGVSYIKSASGGSGGSVSRFSGKGSSKHVFDNGVYGAISAAAGLVGMAATKNPTGFWIGSQTAKGVMGAINSLFK